MTQPRQTTTFHLWAWTTADPDYECFECGGSGKVYDEGDTQPRECLGCNGNGYLNTDGTPPA